MLSFQKTSNLSKLSKLRNSAKGQLKTPSHATNLTRRRFLGAKQRPSM